MFLFVRMVTYLRISNKLRLIVDAFEIAIKDIVIYLTIFMPITIGFAMVFMIIWGPYISFFSVFSESFY